MKIKHYQVKEKTIEGVVGFQVQWFQENYFTNNGFNADWNEIENGWFIDREQAIEKAMELEYEEI